MKRIPILLLLAAPLLYAQDPRPVIAVMPFEASNLGSGERETIERLVRSYLSEIGEFRILTPEDRAEALGERAVEDLLGGGQAEYGGNAGEAGAVRYLLSGSIGSLGGERVLTLEAADVASGERKVVSSVHPNMSELALGIRSLVLQVFQTNEERQAGAGTTENVGSMDEAAVVGTWKGDKGIELVRVFGGGKAIAVFSSGVRMELIYRIEGNEVRFAQTSRNAARFYHPVPYAVAQELVKQAQPMQWRFELSADKTTLRGIKISTAVEYEGETLKTVIPDAERDAAWTRAGR